MSNKFSFTEKRRILNTAHKSLHRRKLTAYFEHGQWWVEALMTGHQWSVVETVNGYGFELVKEGEEI